MNDEINKELHRVCVCSNSEVGDGIVKVCKTCDLPMPYENIAKIIYYNKARLNAKVQSGVTKALLDKPTFNFQRPILSEAKNLGEQVLEAENLRLKYEINDLKAQQRKLRINYTGVVSLLVSTVNNLTHVIGNPSEIVEGAVSDWAEFTGNEYSVTNGITTLIIHG